MKKTLLITAATATLVFANPVMQWELKANEAIFKSGFEAGIKALEFQRKNDGYQPKRVDINKAYYITYDITKMPYEEALFLQNIADKEGFETHITQNFLFFGQFEREADANKAAADLQTKFRIAAKVVKNRGGEFLITYPKLWGEFFVRFIEEAKIKGVTIVREYIPTPQKAQASTSYKPSTKKPTNSSTSTAAGANSEQYFSLKNSKAMAYKKVADTDNSIAFEEKGFVSNKNFVIGNCGKAFVTKQGEKFYKVKNQDTYFSDKDVVLKKQSSPSKCED